MFKMLAILTGISAACLIAQAYAADGTAKAKQNQIITFNQKELQALLSTRGDKPKYYYYYNSPTGVQRYEYRPTHPSGSASSNGNPSQP